MLRVENYPNAYKETYEILKCMNVKDVEKIPQAFMDMIKNKMNKNYVFSINEDFDFESQDILKETKIILAYIFMNYWGTEDQKTIIKEKFRQDVINDEKLKIKYDAKKIFENSKIQSFSRTEELEIIEYRNQNVFLKIINKIKALIKRHK